MSFKRVGIVKLNKVVITANISKINKGILWSGCYIVIFII